MPKIAGTIMGAAKDAARGSRLYDYYKDSAVAAGETKAQGRKDYEADKKMMVPGWDLKRGDAGYEGSDKQFYDKYMDLYEMTGDEAHKDTADTAWRNKQTSDRLAAFNRFEGYDPGKYSGLGEGSRYTGSHREAGEFVPGVGIMDDILDRYYQGQGPGTDTRANQNFVDVKNAMEAMSGLGIAPKADEIWEGVTEDITADLGGDDYYTEGELWEDTSHMPGISDEDYYTRGELPVDEQYSTWGDPGFYNERSRFGNYKDMDRKFGDLSLRNSGFVGPFNRSTGLPFTPNALLPRVDELMVNPNLNSVIDEEEELYVPRNPRSQILGG